jgi:hypothetical protein
MIGNIWDIPMILHEVYKWTFLNINDIGGWISLGIFLKMVLAGLFQMENPLWLGNRFRGRPCLLFDGSLSKFKISMGSRSISMNIALSILLSS